MPAMQDSCCGATGEGNGRGEVKQKAIETGGLDGPKRRLGRGFGCWPELSQVPLDLLDAAEAVLDDVRNLALLPAAARLLQHHPHNDCRGAYCCRREQEV